jgi:hypothetical protein
MSINISPQARIEETYAAINVTSFTYLAKTDGKLTLFASFTLGTGGSWQITIQSSESATAVTFLNNTIVNTNVINYMIPIQAGQIITVSVSGTGSVINYIGVCLEV